MSRSSFQGAGQNRSRVMCAGMSQRRIEARVLEHLTPPHAVVNQDGDVVFCSTHADRYLEPVPHAPDRRILSRAHKELRPDLHAALDEATAGRRTITRSGIPLGAGDRPRTVTLTVEPLGGGQAAGESLFIVLFMEDGAPPGPGRSATQETTPDAAVERIESALRETRGRLQTTAAAHEAVLEKLHASRKALQAAKADLRNLLEGARVAALFLNADMTIRSFTPSAADILNLAPGDRGRKLTDIAGDRRHPALSPSLAEDARAVLAGGEPRERRVDRRDGTARYLARMLPYRPLGGAQQGVAVIFLDVTRLVASEEQQNRLIAELNHRVKNMLTVVIGIASQTLVREGDAEEREAAFLDRLHALSRAYELLSREQWTQVSLHDLLEKEISPYLLEDRDRVVLSGPDLLLDPSCALSLGMAVHELATNAVKYGALSVSTGRVVLSWTAAEAAGARLAMEWQEQGGPAVTSPQRQGFGLTLIHAEVGHGLRGETDIAFEPGGLRARLLIPPGSWRRVAARAEATP